MERRTTRLALFVLFVVAVLSPVNNVFQPHEKTNPYTDTEYQVAAVAVVTGLSVIVAFAQIKLCSAVMRQFRALPLVLSVLFTRRITPVRPVPADTSPLLPTTLRI